MVNNKKDRFVSHEGEAICVMPQCKSCGRCIAEDGLKCTLKGEIPLDVRLNKTKCSDYIEKSR